MARHEGNVARAPERREEVPVRGPGAVASLRNEMNRLFDRFSGRRSGDLVGPDRFPTDVFDFFDWPFGRTEATTFGQTDLSETSEGYELEIDLPGMKRDDVSVDYADGVLTISGERTDDHEEKRKGYYLSERSYGSFRRTFRVPDSVEADRISAHFNDGVLTVRLPKSEEAQKNSRRIEVNTG